MALVLCPTLAARQDLPWTVRQLAIDANEGCAIGDIDGDGGLDFVAGRNWYAGPDFVARPLRLIEDWNGYVQSNGDFLFDVNQDGRLDVIAGSFLPTEVHWFENPGTEALRLGQLWPKHLLIDTTFSENESQLLADLNGDGQPEWIVNSWNPKNPLIVWRLVATDAELPLSQMGSDPAKAGEGQTPFETGAKFKMVPAKLAESGNSHGMGIGDLNGDGRIDVLTGSGWYEHPSEKPWDQTWTFHADWQIQGSIPMLVTDLDGDGKNDILVGEGHDFGLYWWRQQEPKGDDGLVFEKKLIDKSFSQPHALALADLDGDGVEELITGKRYFAHNGGDPGGRDEPLLCYYKYDPSIQSFQKTIIEQGHVGTGLQICTGDLDGNQSIDIAVAGKGGTYLLLNPAVPLKAGPETRELVGWTLRVHPELLTKQSEATTKALELLQAQLEEIVRVVPEEAVAELKKVPLWLSPEYPSTPPRAEYHPNKGWLKRNGRDEQMAKGVEFTNVRIFEAETRRMPNFALHELAHAYHDRVLENGFRNEEIQLAFDRAKASGIFDHVERQDSEGRKTVDRSYALTSPQELFAESTEAFFSKNDFFPYDNAELKKHDPQTYWMIMELWGVKMPKSAR